MSKKPMSNVMKWVGGPQLTLKKKKDSAVYEPGPGGSSSGQPANLNKQWVHPPDVLSYGRVEYHVRYLGEVEVSQAKGTEVIKEAIQKIRFNLQLKRSAAGNAASKLPKVQLLINVDGLSIVDAKNRMILYKYPLHRISFCADDKQDKRVFSFIAKQADTNKHNCFVFLSEKLAEEITLTIGEAFDLAYRKFLDNNGRNLTSQKQLIVLKQRIGQLETENGQLKQRLLQYEPDDPRLLPSTAAAAAAASNGLNNHHNNNKAQGSNNMQQRAGQQLSWESFGSPSSPPEQQQKPNNSSGTYGSIFAPQLPQRNQHQHHQQKPPPPNIPLPPLPTSAAAANGGSTGGSTSRNRPTPGGGPMTVGGHATDTNTAAMLHDLAANGPDVGKNLENLELENMEDIFDDEFNPRAGEPQKKKPSSTTTTDGKTGGIESGTKDPLQLGDPFAMFLKNGQGASKAQNSSSANANGHPPPTLLPSGTSVDSENPSAEDMENAIAMIDSRLAEMQEGFGGGNLSMANDTDLGGQDLLGEFDPLATQNNNTKG